MSFWMVPTSHTDLSKNESCVCLVSIYHLSINSQMLTKPNTHHLHLNDHFWVKHLPHRLSSITHSETSIGLDLS